MNLEDMVEARVSEDAQMKIRKHSALRAAKIQEIAAFAEAARLFFGDTLVDALIQSRGRIDVDYQGQSVRLFFTFRNQRYNLARTMHGTGTTWFLDTKTAITSSVQLLRELNGQTKGEECI